MDERVAVLEANVAHLQTDVTEMKGDIKGLSVRICEFKDFLTVKIESTDKRLSEKIEALKDSLAFLKLWALWLYVLMAGMMLSVMARAFKWI